MKLNLSADEVLTTTRSVRKRLDFDTPVDKNVILECLEIALQAPTGSNSQGWQWMFIDDEQKKDAIAAMYRRNFAEYAKSAREFPEGDTRQSRQTAVRDSAQYLADNFQRVPVMMIPMIEGRLDGLSVAHAAGAWGSLLPAVWSFMLALRERGLGSAWTTLHLPNERETAEVLGIPFERYTQGGLFPIAYTLGTDFKPAKRLDVASLVHWNSF
jgi:nitroreductase